MIFSLVHDSPGHKPVNLSTDNNRLSDISCADSCLHNNIRSNNSGRRSQLTEDIPWPSVEMQSELFGHGDTSSLGDLTADCPGHRVNTGLLFFFTFLRAYHIY